MARKSRSRRSRNSSRKHSRKYRKYINKNIINKTVKRGVTSVKYTSKKYMPRVKSGIEGVGSKVTSTAAKTVPILQKTTRDLLGVFGIKKKR
jgi:hypothetical protein